MILVGSHIITPLGDSVEANIARILAGDTPDEIVHKLPEAGDFANRCVRSITEALQKDAVPVNTTETVIIVSSTKGEDLDLITPAQRICEELENPNPPIVVSNACTSGVCAQIVANRLIESGQYKYAVVVGCDIVTEFIRSGFEALKALSDTVCCPFDAHRDGLNLGEAVATMVFAADEYLAFHPKQAYWHYEAGCMHNDANHLTGPSREGEGSFRCLCEVLEGVDAKDVTMIGLHGTGTVYNDEMESIALYRAGLSAVPANSLKGYFGHTLGAAGLLETILCLRALEERIILPTKGFTEQGTTYPVAVNAAHRHIEGNNDLHFIKLLSGFGGTNAAVRYKRICNP